MLDEQLSVTDAVIVGAGFGGLAAAEYLKRAGLTYTMLDRGASVGGTWRENRYPGCACDIPSHLYSFSFSGSPNWSRRFSGRREIHDYLKRVADEREITRHVRFEEEMVEARFDETNGLWTVRTRKGKVHRTRFLISAVGGLSRPMIPRLNGIELFRGSAFHTAQWPDHFDPANLRIAVIGTGASAVQLIPELAKRAAHVDVYQRTPAWIGPKPDTAYSSRTLAGMRRLPFLRALRRTAIYVQRELFWLGLNRPGLNAKLERQIRAFLAHEVADPVLRAKLTPDYRVGCKRVLQSNDFYSTMQRGNVSLITAGIVSATETGLVDRAGIARAYDAIIYGTGFSASDLIGDVAVINAAGTDLRAVWPRGIEAYLGTFVRDFPNFFTVLGPNTGLGHNSIIFMLECQAKMIARVIRHAKRRGWGSVAVRPEVQELYNEEIQRRLAGTVWASGCASWYQHASGRINTLWPQDHKAAFVAGTGAGARATVNSGRLINAAGPYVLTAGSTIAAAVVTGLSSDLPGEVVAQVTEDVFDSTTGRTRLIPQGARLIGSYDAHVTYGQSRALVVWTRLILPDGRSLDLDRLIGTDAAGQSGFAGRVSHHTGKLIEAGLLSSLFGVGTNLATSGGGSNNDIAFAIRDSAGQSVERAGDKLVGHQLDVQPTITIRPGARVRVLVSRDLVLEPWPETAR